MNLGIGLPCQVAAYLPRGASIFLQSENGLIGLGPRPPRGMENPNLTDAGGGFITAFPGAASFDSSFSFGLIRGGHLDLTVLGGLQVDAQGHLANWMVPGKLVAAWAAPWTWSQAQRVIVAMTHTARGTPKIVERCELPLTSVRPVNLIVTELAVIEPTHEGLLLHERGPGVSIEQIVAATAARLIIPEAVPEMNLGLTLL